MDELSGQLHSSGVARRRRERRMRSLWRHQLQAIRMATATVMHHSFGPIHNDPWGQKTATMAWREERSEMNDAMGQKVPPCAAFFRMYDEEDADPGCGHLVWVSRLARWTRSSETPCRSRIPRLSLCRTSTVRRRSLGVRWLGPCSVLRCSATACRAQL